ncbi:Tyrosine-protein phosphatase 2 [Madurella fahalii]|uniref:Tyrosine-protein phosphatase 2 n=1 Tax=Madurella fahalii TaxID=1157608 RepID=A0ABQ0GIF7_9PEZI
MDHLPRFHRRRKDVAAPPLITSDLSAKMTSPPGDPHSVSPMRPFQKLSPFRVFHRSSGKRARDSPPASLPHSPAEAPALARDSADGRPVSPLSLKTDSAGEERQTTARPPKMPAFLDLSDHDIMNRFSELVWRERNRLMQSVTNPSPDFRWARVTGPHLKTLDRYMNVQPWHNNRIKLQVPEGHVDYINASPIVVTSSHCAAPAGPDRYIAMQGPKQTSTDHVWRMVVEQLESPGVIVMLTETHEGHMEKCFPYFPRGKEDPPLEINERDEFGDGFRATVRCEGIEETPAGDAIELRKLVIRVHTRPRVQMTVSETPRTPEPTATEETDADSDVKMKSPSPRKPTATTTSDNAASPPQSPKINTAPAASEEEEGKKEKEKEKEKEEQQDQQEQEEERIVYHFLYKKWPDFGVPSLSDLDSFFTLMRLSREKNASPNNPRIVHCSAGVGRSGTFIALEHLMRELDAGTLANYDESWDTAETAGDAGLWLEKGDLVFDTVNQLREQRRTMVQAESQYIFIYRVLRKLWVEKYGDSAPKAEEAVEEGGERAAKRLEVDPELVEGE